MSLRSPINLWIREQALVHGRGPRLVEFISAKKNNTLEGEEYFAQIEALSLKLTQIISSASLQKDRARSPVFAILDNGLEWDLLEKSCFEIGVPISGCETFSTAEWMEEVFSQIDPVAIFIESEKIRERLPKKITEACPIFIKRQGSSGITPEWKVFFSSSSPQGVLNPETNLAEAPACIVFTSGTTGRPKAIVYRQDQILETAKRIIDSFLGERKVLGLRSLSWLPMCNLFQRNLNLCALGAGVAVYFWPNPRAIVRGMKWGRPHLMIGVPRFFEKICEGLPNWSLRVSKLRNWVLKKIFGGQIEFLISGSASLMPKIQEVFEQAGLPIYEAYGLSECVLPVSLNTLKERQRGTVGRPLLLKDQYRFEGQELILKKNCWFLGKNLEGQSHAEDFFTGDQIEIDPEGYWHHHGRESDTVKLSTGKKLFRPDLEASFKNWPEVSSAVVLAEGLRFPVLLLSGPKIRRLKFKTFKARLDELCLQQPKLASIGAVIFLERELNVDKQEMTNNLKVRYKQIQLNLKEEIDKILSAQESSQGALSQEKGSWHFLERTK